MPGRLEFAMSFNRPKANRKSSDGPMRLLVMGDFSAGGSAQRKPLATRPTHRVDADNFDHVMTRIAPKLSLAAGEIDFMELDDFHPDSLYTRLDVFHALRQARANPSAGHDNLLGSLLGKAAGGTSHPASTPVSNPASAIDALIHKIAAPSAVPDRTAQMASYLAAVDAAIAEQMRKILHDPAFQSLESAWRGVHWLISSLELDEDLQLHLLDVSREELLADVIAAEGQLAQTGLHHALADRWRNLPDGESWSLLCSLYAFGASDTDIGLMAALGLIASQAGGPFIATADPALSAGDATALAGWNALRGSEAAPWIGLASPRVLLRLPYGRASDPIVSFGFEELGPGEPAHEELLWGHASLAAGDTALALPDPAALAGWQTLRSSEAAPWIGLAAPRVLMRAPYGKRSDPITAFAFEELPAGVPDHENLLWGPSSLAVALLIARAFAERGWSFEPGDEREIGDLPAYTFERDGEKEMQACAETYLGEQAVQALLGAGLMPVLSHKNRNAVTVMRFQSIAEPPQALAGLGMTRPA